MELEYSHGVENICAIQKNPQRRGAHKCRMAFLQERIVGGGARSGVFGLVLDTVTADWSCAVAKLTDASMRDLQRAETRA